MKVLMTGATGYIGRKLVQRLAADGHEIYAVVRKSSRTEELKPFVKGILYSKPYLELFEQVQNIHPDIYINLAGTYCGNHSPEQIGMLLDANVILPAYAADAAVRAGVRHIIHTSSYQQCYNGEEYYPINFYAATKRSFEDILTYYTSDGSVNAVTLQLFDTYGADDTRRKVFNLVRALKDGESLDLSPGMQKLYFVYIDDVIEAYVSAMHLLETKEAGFYRKYAVRSEVPVRLKEFAKRYVKLTGKNVQLNWGKRSYAKKEIMDPTGYGETLPGWKALVSYEEGLKRCADWD
jgi:CDP-3, 6-dideoxy-D-glycero-L-glycero-4-hexulose-4-reductase